MFNLELRADRARGIHAAWYMEIIMCLVAAVWSAVRLLHVSLASPPDLSELSFPPHRSVSRVTALTDRGRSIRLFECTEPRFAKPNSDELPRFLKRRIVSGSSDPRANCHGWVFTGGRYFVDGRDVDAILSNNCYETVVEPLVDDLVVWRDSDQLPVHTGIVKATGLEGFVLVESKWGHMGRYLHEPQTAAYPENFSFYRSPRTGHRLRLLPAPESPEAMAGHRDSKTE